ncbi:phosphodiesterase [Olegusella massiliensis]|uniref:phosphodiesterase n=1 Tax=Olegusella massiliensis TaxID=1776381 RepID=UPI0023F61B72|nr:phosphodiesterase [Olegusella massiliensis]
MKLLIASDIHGAAAWCKKLMSAIEQEQPDRVLLLGDLLYHGPRNDVPADYAPREVIAMLNSIATQVVAVRGNCEAEVDQMVLDFPCLAESAVILDSTAKGNLHELFLTHGHIWGAGRDNSIDRLPPLPAHTSLVYGHTHIKANEASAKRPDLWLFNPGSIGIPKDGSHSYGLYANGHFEHRILND